MLQNYSRVSIRLKKLTILSQIVCNPKDFVLLLNGNTDFDEAFTDRTETYKEEVTRDDVANGKL